MRQRTTTVLSLRLYKNRVAQFTRQSAKIDPPSVREHAQLGEMILRQDHEQDRPGVDTPAQALSIGCLNDNLSVVSIDLKTDVLGEGAAKVCREMDFGLLADRYPHIHFVCMHFDGSRCLDRKRLSLVHHKAVHRRIKNRRQCGASDGAQQLQLRIAKPPYRC